MISVAGLDLSVLEDLCEKAARQTGTLGDRDAVCKAMFHLKFHFFSFLFYLGGESPLSQGLHVFRRQSCCGGTERRLLKVLLELSSEAFVRRKEPYKLAS